MWSQIFLILSCILSAAYIYRRLDHSPLFYLVINLTLLSLVIGHIFDLLDTDILEYTIEIVFLITMLLTLITLMVSVRLFQPQHMRYPIFYSYIPILILPFYLFYIDNQSLSDLIMMILQASAYMVYLLIVLVHQKELENKWLLFLSIIIFFFLLIFNWTLDYDYTPNSLSHLLLSAGIITGAMSLPVLINKTSR